VVPLLSAGGYANAAAQDSFRDNTTCVVTIIYDQTSRHNNLTVAPAGGADSPSPADALPVTRAGTRCTGCPSPA
jgi:non-reducing end alpha-L-arabinofuranosidase